MKITPPINFLFFFFLICTAHSSELLFKAPPQYPHHAIGVRGIYPYFDKAVNRDALTYYSGMYRFYFNYKYNNKVHYIFSWGLTNFNTDNAMARDTLYHNVMVDDFSNFSKDSKEAASWTMGNIFIGSQTHGKFATTYGIYLPTASGKSENLAADEGLKSRSNQLGNLIDSYNPEKYRPNQYTGLVDIEKAIFSGNKTQFLFSGGGILVVGDQDYEILDLTFHYTLSLYHHYYKGNQVLLEAGGKKRFVDSKADQGKTLGNYLSIGYKSNISKHYPSIFISFPISKRQRNFVTFLLGFRWDFELMQ
jgi:hypothetical protein